jgi:hypothetical protein
MQDYQPQPAPSRAPLPHEGEPLAQRIHNVEGAHLAALIEHNDRFASVFERLRSLEREVRGEAADEPRPITPGDPGSVVVHELPDILTARKGAFVAHDRFRTRSGPPREDDRERAPVDLDNEPFVDEPGEGGA